MRTSLPVSVSVLQRNGISKVSIDAEIDRDKDIRDHALQELVHTIWKLRSSTVYPLKTEDSGKLVVYFCLS